jgi:hypothetical protein
MSDFWRDLYISPSSKLPVISHQDLQGCSKFLLQSTYIVLSYEHNDVEYSIIMTCITMFKWPEP